MLRVVLDTNILVSSIFWSKGSSHRIIELALERKIEVFASVEILKELEKVLRRDFEEPEEIINRRVALILSYATAIKPNLKLIVIKDDPDDNKILECAVSCNADYVVSGDQHLLSLKEFEKIKIVAPKEFLDIMEK